MPRTIACAAMAIILAGCSMRADFSQTSFQCDESTRCPDPQVCVDGLCRAGPLDAAPRPDAGIPTLAPWQTTAPLPEARDYNAGHAGFARGFIYLVGGYSAAETTEKDTVFRAQIGQAGELVSWDETTALPAARALADVVAVGNRLYVIGGAATAAAQDTVYHAAVAADGTVGSWITTTPLPERRKGHTALAAGGYLYVLGGEDESGDRHETAFVGRLETNGGVEGWSAGDPLPEARTAMAGAYDGGAIYLAGGLDNSSVIGADVFVAPVDPVDGSVGPWTTTTRLPTPRRSAVAFASRGHFYLVGGMTEGGVTDEVTHALIGDDRELGAWQDNTPLPAGRARHAGVLADGFFYVIGGIGGEDGTVLYTSAE